MNLILIGVCGLVFLYEAGLGEQARALVLRFGVTPAAVSTTLFTGHLQLQPLLTLFTSMFLHGDFWHLAGNMLYLFVFGDNVEDRLGHVWYGVFYLLAGVGAALVEVYFHPSSSVPLIGASGAIAGVLGAYFLLYPRARILTLIPLFVYFPVVEIRAFVFLGVWFVMQFTQGSLSDGADSQGGIAWWAHAGGFVVGAGLLPLMLLLKALRR